MDLMSLEMHQQRFLKMKVIVCCEVWLDWKFKICFPDWMKEI